MKIHYIMHETFEGLGCIKDWIRQKGYQVSVTRTFLFEPFPEMDEFDFLIIMGGAMSTHEEDRFPWLKTEKLFIRQAIHLNKTVLGICFGAQLIAEALGSEVYKGKHREIGWFPVKFYKNNLPSVFKSLPESLTVFHWHGDTFDIPKGALHLAESEATPNQAFRFKENVIALQFHLEMNEKTIKLMSENVEGQLQKSKFVQSVQEINSTTRYFKENNKIMLSVLDYLESRYSCK